ncbi:MAG: LPS assembly lipoprotein LptE [Myxococcota bacterium]
MPLFGPSPKPLPVSARAFLAATVLSLLAIGCGYRSVGAPASRAFGAEAKATVAVVALRNDTPEPWLDRVVTDALRRELGLRGAIRLESDPNVADYVLRGRVLPLGVRSNSFSSFVVALEYQVTLSLELEVLRREGDVIRLPARSLSESDVYLASQDIEVTRTNRLEALRHLSDVIATRVADRVEWMAEPPKTTERSPAEAAGG